MTTRGRRWAGTTWCRCSGTSWQYIAMCGTCSISSARTLGSRHNTRARQSRQVRCANAGLWMREYSLHMLFPDLKDTNKNYSIFFLSFSAYYFLKIHLHHFSKRKKSKNTRKLGFSSYFCLRLMEGSGSVPPTNGSGSKRPKDIRIRIQNTGLLNGKDKGTGPGWIIVFNRPDHLVLAKRRKNHWILNHLIILRCPTLSVGGGGLQVFDTMNS